ncbi:TsaA-like domain-containing protein [Gaertneriomyces semiglobifer]|nr:TsaA-like domain-containing protein [Gaertneriomyces semiglobifer]
MERRHVDLVVACLMGVVSTFTILKWLEARSIQDVNKGENEDERPTKGQSVSSSKSPSLSPETLQSQEEDLHTHCQQRIKTERLGRIRAEKTLRSTLLTQIHQSGYPLHIIGTVSSPYTARRGTPRQGLLVPSSVSYLTLHSSIPTDTLLGLDTHSHIFILFLFHENTNLPKTLLSQPSHRGTSCKSAGFSGRVPTFAARVLPPLLDGGKVGVFATRAPHRPNALGMSLARVVEVDVENRRVTVAGADIVDGTPVVDIKPWGVYDCPSCFKSTVFDGQTPGKLDPSLLAASSSSIVAPSIPPSFYSPVIPNWILSGLLHPYILPVRFLPDALESLTHLVSTSQCRFYHPGQEQNLIDAITQILGLDIRSTLRGRGKGPQVSTDKSLNDDETANGSDTQPLVATDLIGSRLLSSTNPQEVIEQFYEFEYDTLHVDFVVKKDDEFDGKPWVLVKEIRLRLDGVEEGQPLESS